MRHTAAASFSCGTVGSSTNRELPARFFSSASREILALEVARPPLRAVAAAAAAEAPFGLWPRFIDDQGAAVHAVFVQLRDRLGGFLVRAHFDERETACAPGCHVAHDADVVDLARLAE